MKIGFVIYPQYQTIDLAGPMDAFALANELMLARGREDCPYELITLSKDADTIVSESGLKTLSDCRFVDCPPLDTLVLPGGSGSRKLYSEHQFVGQITALASDARRVVSICTGSYLLAATGLVDGGTLSTHWQFAEDMQTRFGQIKVQAEKLFVQKGKFYSSGGMTAGVDLALAIIAEDCGEEISQQVARHMVMYVRRSGDQRQYSQLLKAQQNLEGRFQSLLSWLMTNLDQAIKLEDMAQQVSLSPRHFSRVFKQKQGQSPMAFLLALRTDKARELLLTSELSVEQISLQTGFSQGDVFRRQFKQSYGISPSEYRMRFSAALMN